MFLKHLPKFPFFKIRGYQLKEETQLKACYSSIIINGTNKDKVTGI